MLGIGDVVEGREEAVAVSDYISQLVQVNELATHARHKGRNHLDPFLRRALNVMDGLGFDVDVSSGCVGGW